jgi:TatD DNase family protein
LKGVFHAFTGDTALAEEIIDLGYLLGIGGILTFKNSHLSEVVASIDLNHLVLETDSPYLAPVPYRGKRNESSYVPIIANYLAQIKKTGIDEVAEITTTNAKSLFGL